MRIDQLYIENFRGITDMRLDLDPRLNVFIGDNGSGKTAVLEALTIAAGSFFIGMQSTSSKGFSLGDVRIAKTQELVTPVMIQAQGVVHQQGLSWSREKKSIKGSTTTKNAANLTKLSKGLDEQVRKGETEVNLPVISYFSTGRLFRDVRLRKEKKGSSKKDVHAGSRFRGYQNALDAKSNFKTLLKWMEGKEYAQIQKGREDIGLRLVKQAIINTLPNCDAVYFDLDPDTKRGLVLEFSDGEVLPIEYLSDGMRNFIALMADIAHRCVLLNPQLKEQSLVNAEGIVMIDELDLHLHPNWQKGVINSLLNTFPKIQFMVTTHSPFLIQETQDEQLFVLRSGEVKTISGAHDQSIEDIAEHFQGLELPQWSSKRKEMFALAKEYYQAVKKGEVTDDLKERFQQSMKPFSPNTAYHAILEQERIIKEYQKNNSLS